eukprot:1019712-Prymnesium_polylepis.1
MAISLDRLIALLPHRLELPIALDCPRLPSIALHCPSLPSIACPSVSGGRPTAVWRSRGAPTCGNGRRRSEYSAGRARCAAPCRERGLPYSR